MSTLKISAKMWVETCADLKRIADEVTALKAENAKLYVALQQYADDSRWFYARTTDEWFWTDPKGLVYGGPKAARDALEPKP